MLTCSEKAILRPRSLPARASATTSTASILCATELPLTTHFWRVFAQNSGLLVARHALDRQRVALQLIAPHRALDVPHISSRGPHDTPIFGPDLDFSASC